MPNKPTNTQLEHRVLAIDPTTKGFGYTVFEGPERLIAWELAYVRYNKHVGGLRRVAKLLDRYQPTMLVLEDETGSGSRRCERVKLFLQATRVLAKKRKIKVKNIAPCEVYKTFEEANATNKNKIAALIAARYPELLPRLPPVRRTWMPEDHRMGIFDAAALALTFFHLFFPASFFHSLFFNPTTGQTLPSRKTTTDQIMNPGEIAVETFLAGLRK